MKELLVVLVTCLLLASCIKEGGNTIAYKNVLLNFTALNIPETATSGTSVNISAETMANNTCWDNLHFELSREADFIYTLKAFGDFSTSDGICLLTENYCDTVISFQPVTGTYVFKVYTDSTIINKSMVVTP